MNPKLLELIKKVGEKYIKSDKETKIQVGMKLLGRRR